MAYYHHRHSHHVLSCTGLVFCVFAFIWYGAWPIFLTLFVIGLILVIVVNNNDNDDDDDDDNAVACGVRR